MHLFIYRQESFEPRLASGVALLFHVLLHITSFQFELPRNRIWTKPMIWKEFRVHNAIFAYRHLACTALGIWAPNWWWRNPGVTSVIAKMALACCVCKAADVATERLGSLEKRTTNAMPYPKQTGTSVEQVAKWFYAKSQFAATSLAVFGTPSLAFCSILAIEVASFLMTLVRKGLIQDRTYHIIYAAALFVMFPSIVCVLHGGDRTAEMATFRALIATCVAVELRMSYRCSKYLTWILAIFAGGIWAEVLAYYVGIKVIAWPGMMSSVWNTLNVFLRAKQSEDNGKGKGDATEAAGAGKVPERSNLPVDIHLQGG